MEKTAIYAGTFDPITLGHVDILERASRLFERVIVLVSQNMVKQTMFSIEERIEFIKDATEHLTNIELYQHRGGLTVDVARHLQAQVLIRGVRNVVDFEYEQNIATLNHFQQADIETVMLFSNEKYRALSSSFIKEIAQHGGDISSFVPKSVASAIYERFRFDDRNQLTIEKQ